MKRKFAETESQMAVVEEIEDIGIDWKATALHFKLNRLLFPDLAYYRLTLNTIEANGKTRNHHHSLCVRLTEHPHLSTDPYIMHICDHTKLDFWPPNKPPKVIRQERGPTIPKNANPFTVINVVKKYAGFVDWNSMENKCVLNNSPIHLPRETRTLEDVASIRNGQIRLAVLLLFFSDNMVKHRLGKSNMKHADQKPLRVDDYTAVLAVRKHFTDNNNATSLQERLIVVPSPLMVDSVAMETATRVVTPEQFDKLPASVKDNIKLLVLDRISDPRMHAIAETLQGAIMCDRSHVSAGMDIIKGGFARTVISVPVLLPILHIKASTQQLQDNMDENLAIRYAIATTTLTDCLFLTPSYRLVHQMAIPDVKTHDLVVASDGTQARLVNLSCRLHGYRKTIESTNTHQPPENLVTVDYLLEGDNQTRNLLAEPIHALSVSHVENQNLIPRDNVMLILPADCMTIKRTHLLYAALLARKELVILVSGTRLSINF